MTRKKPVKHRVPRTRGGGTFTEAQFWSFIRSGLREKSKRWPPKFQVLQAARRHVKGKRHKWEYQCAECGKWKMQKLVEVDHITPCGSLKSYEDISTFARRLFCEPSGLRVVCKMCHNKITKEARDAKSISK